MVILLQRRISRKSPQPPLRVMGAVDFFLGFWTRREAGNIVPDAESLAWSAWNSFRIVSKLHPPEFLCLLDFKQINKFNQIIGGWGL